MIDNFTTFLQSGGPVMIPIILVSIVGLTLTLERAVATKESRVIPAVLQREIKAYIEQSRMDDALASCLKHPCAYSSLVSLIINSRSMTRDQVKALVEEEGRQWVAGLERGLGALATMANISPMLGLVGTVWGMILTFDAIQVEGMGSISGLAGGISQALITTLAGLCVGIPLLVLHRWLIGRVDSLALTLEKESVDLLSTLVCEEK
jgi:biopolymer transport protein ExbB